jgi:hypothetical protein
MRSTLLHRWIYTLIVKSPTLGPSTKCEYYVRITIRSRLILHFGLLSPYLPAVRLNLSLPKITNSEGSHQFYQEWDQPQPDPITLRVCSVYSRSSRLVIFKPCLSVSLKCLGIRSCGLGVSSTIDTRIFGPITPHETI